MDLAQLTHGTCGVGTGGRHVRGGVRRVCRGIDDRAGDGAHPRLALGAGRYRGRARGADRVHGRGRVRAGDLAAALGRWEAADGSSDVRLAVAALALGLSTGGARAQAIDGVAATIRARLDARAEAWALATQGRLSATVLAAAPVAFCVLAAAGGGGTASFLLRTRPGLACLAGGLSLDGLGAAWMARLTRLSVT